MPKVFLTGATGFLGGDILHPLITTHPTWPIAFLVRNTPKVFTVATTYPHLSLITGELDNITLIEDQASQADIVIHEQPATNMSRLLRLLFVNCGGVRGSGRVLHIYIGHAEFGDENFVLGVLGKGLGRVFDDWDAMEDLIGLLEDAPHRRELQLAEAWNEKGYYLAETGFYVVREMLQLVARTGYEKGFVASSDVDFLSANDADRLLPYSSYLLRGVALRARKVLS